MDSRHAISDAQACAIVCLYRRVCVFGAYDFTVDRFLNLDRVVLTFAQLALHTGRATGTRGCHTTAQTTNSRTQLGREHWEGACLVAWLVLERRRKDYCVAAVRKFLFRSPLAEVTALRVMGYRACKALEITRATKVYAQSIYNLHTHACTLAMFEFFSRAVGFFCGRS